MLLCRPDQHVAWTGNMGKWASFDNFFHFGLGVEGEGRISALNSSMMNMARTARQVILGLVSPYIY